jgi:oxygen-independent coproporphyrinogen-3 oxidase
LQAGLSGRIVFSPEGGEAVRKDKPSALYVHIPFCKHKCHYCDFNTYAVHGQPVETYLAALEREMRLAAESCPPPVIETIFVGGGTPTILEPEQMRRLLEALPRYFPEWSPEVEFTMEANPGTVDARKLAAMREGGVNRISFGAQSFDNGLLKRIGRIHEADEIVDSVRKAREAGFSNLSIDLMFGLPGQTLRHVRESVERALELELPHYSLYSLKVEENTLFHTLYQRGELPLPEEDEEAEMYETIIAMLTAAGYEHYEISNFARPGYASRHNMKYWLNHSYYGLGAGAHGYVNGVRYENVRGVKDYIAAVERGLPVRESAEVDDDEAMEDFMMVGLRLLRGVRDDDFRAQFGRRLDDVFGREIDRLVAEGLLERTAHGCRLTRRGLMYGNDVFARFIRS